MKILLIEDDADDLELLEEALQMNEVEYSMDVVRDGLAAVDYIKNNDTVPSIVLMDFNVPKIHGRELLKQIKGTARFRGVPVVILSTSSAQGDIDYSYKHGADKYIIKPVSLAEFKVMIDVITELAKDKTLAEK